MQNNMPITPNQEQINVDPSFREQVEQLITSLKVAGGVVRGLKNFTSRF
jgi:hypothetical protein